MAIIKDDFSVYTSHCSLISFFFFDVKDLTRWILTCNLRARSAS